MSLFVSVDCLMVAVSTWCFMGGYLLQGLCLLIILFCTYCSVFFCERGGGVVWIVFFSMDL